MIDLYEAMSTLRAVRRLRPDPIPDEVLERVLQAACWAPTGGNLQPWNVVVVRDEGKRAALADLYAPVWVEGVMKTESLSATLSFVDGSDDIPVAYQLEAQEVTPYE